MSELFSTTSRATIYVTSGALQKSHIWLRELAIVNKLRLRRYKTRSATGPFLSPLVFLPRNAMHSAVRFSRCPVVVRLSVCYTRVYVLDRNGWRYHQNFFSRPGSLVILLRRRVVQHSKGNTPCFGSEMETGWKNGYFRPIAHHI